jgi:hypothetical protein
MKARVIGELGKVFVDIEGYIEKSQEPRWK